MKAELPRRGRGHPAARVLAGAFVPTAAVLARAKPLPRGIRAAAAVAAPLALALAARPGRLRSAGLWALQMQAYKLVFELPHERPLAQRRRLRADLPLRLDTAIGRGTPVPLRLQRALRRPGEVGALDVAVSVLYASWGLEPHVALGWVLARHPERFARAALRLGATFDAALPVYASAPTPPPWWHAQVKHVLPADLERVSVEVKRALQGKPRDQSGLDVGGNPWASTPSDHFATAAAVALALSDVDRRAASLAAGYAVLLGCACVYLGEHYAADILAGLLLAVGVRLAERPVEPLVRELGRRFARLERAVHG